MQLSSNFNNGLVEELNRLCGTTVNNYSFKEKTADLNSALDWYFDIGERSSNNWNNDDSNQTSPPIDTQNIVSGTNRYKLSNFTSEITDILKLEVDDGTGVAKALTVATLDSFGNVVGNQSGQLGETGSNSFDDVYINAPSGIPTAYIKYGNFIYLNRKPNYNATAGLKVYFNRPASKFLFYSVVANTDDTLTATAHGLVAGDTVLFETDGTIPTGLTADTKYYVISSGLTADVFKVSTTLGGSAVDITNAQTSSNHAFLQTSKSPGINSMHHPALVNYAAYRFMSFNNTKGVYNSRLQTLLPQIQKDENMIETHFTQRDKDVRERITVFYQNNH